MTALPTLQPTLSSTPATPGAVVETFLAALVATDLTRAATLLDDDVEYTNVGLPSVRGARRVRRVLSPFERRGLGFEAYLHTLATSGDSVLTERTDVLVLGPVRMQFWVAGRFDVRDPAPRRARRG